MVFEGDPECLSTLLDDATHGTTLDGITKYEFITIQLPGGIDWSVPTSSHAQTWWMVK